jgi:hypothetical protein
MALYKDGDQLQQSQDGAFDALHRPGGATPHSGIYHCTGCRREVVSEEGRPLPPQNHHQHSAQQDAIMWRMIVYANHKPR